MIIGSDQEFHAQYMYECLQSRGTDCFYLNTASFPTALKLNLALPSGSTPGLLITPEGRKIPLESVRSVYWRYHHGIEVSKEISPEITYIIHREIDSALGSLFRNMPNALWINSVEAIDMHRYKAHQLFLLSQAGLPIPDTLVSNDPEEILAFYDRHHGNLIYKPVAGGAHTERIKPDDVTPERLQNLALCPVKFQQCIEGVDIRVYLIGNAVFAAEIQAETLDFREDPNAPIIPITLPQAVEQQCHTLAKQLGYHFTGIDIRRTPKDEYIFIEGNPSPMFFYFEQQTGYPITETLIQLLETGVP